MIQIVYVSKDHIVIQIVCVSKDHIVIQIVCVGKDDIVIQIVCASEILNLLMPSLQNFITSPRLLSGNVLLVHVSFSLLLLLFFFHTFLSARFLGDALIKLYETL